MQLNTVDYGVFALGFMAAFVSALFAVRALLHYIAHHNFRVFAWYRIIFGLIVLYYYS
jgi:undecaprenyl-diphosphatase